MSEASTRARDAPAHDAVVLLERPRMGRVMLPAFRGQQGFEVTSFDLGPLGSVGPLLQGAAPELTLHKQLDVSTPALLKLCADQVPVEATLHLLARRRPGGPLEVERTYSLTGARVTRIDWEGRRDDATPSETLGLRFERVTLVEAPPPVSPTSPAGLPAPAAGGRPSARRGP